MDFDIKVIVPMKLAAQFNEAAPNGLRDRYNTSDLIEVFSSSAMSKIVDQQLALQEAVLSVLPKDQDLLHVKSRERFEEILSSPKRAVILVREKASQRLVAQSIALLPDREDPDADMIDMKLPGKPESLSTLCGVVSHPEMRGRDLMLHMVDTWLGMMGRLDRRHALAVVTTDNVRSWVSFLHKGLHITSAGHDPADNSIVYYLHKDLKRAPANQNDKPLQEMTFDPDLPLSEMKKAFAKGWVGYRAEQSPDTQKYTKRLILAKKKFVLGPK